MPNLTAICYLSSLLFYGMGYSKTLVIQNAFTVNTTYDYTIHVSLATGYFVLAILLAIIGSLIYYVQNNKDQEAIEMKDIEFRIKAGRKLDDRRRASIMGVKTQLTQSE